MVKEVMSSERGVCRIRDKPTWLAKAFDFGEVVGGEEDGGFSGALEKAFDELISNERIKAAKGHRER